MPFAPTRAQMAPPTPRLYTIMQDSRLLFRRSGQVLSVSSPTHLPTKDTCLERHLDSAQTNLCRDGGLYAKIQQ